MPNWVIVTDPNNKNRLASLGIPYFLPDLKVGPFLPVPQGTKPGFSGLHCRGGHEIPLTNYVRLATTCTIPGCPAPYVDTTKISICAASVRFTNTINPIFKTAWWHVSENSNLFDEPDTGDFLHLGTFRAALHRAQQKAGMRMSTKNLYIYRITFKRDTIPVASRIVVENYPVDPDNLLVRDVAGPGIARYLNRAEDPGSISLLTPRNKIVGKVAFKIPLSDLMPKKDGLKLIWSFPTGTRV